MSDNVLLHATIFVLILVSCTITGRQVCDWFRIRAESFIQQTTFALLLGLGTLSVTMFFVAVVGAIYAPVILAILIVPMIVFWQQFRSGLADFRTFVRNGADVPIWALIGVFIAIVPVCLNYFEAFLAPRTDDALSAYLLIPKQYLEAHRMVIRYDNWPSFSPFLCQSLNLVALAIGSDRFPHALNTTLAILLGLTLFDYLFRRTGSAAALVATIAALSTPMLITKAANGSQVDMLFTMYSTCSIIALAHYLDDDDSGMLWMTFLAMGLANTAKYVGIALYVVLTGAVYCLALCRTRSIGKTLLHHRSIIIAVCIAPFACYLVRNLIVTGNPFYPLMNSVFNGKYWPHASNEYMRMSVTSTSGYLGYFRVADLMGLAKLFLSKNYYDRMPPVYLFMVPLILPYLFRRVATWVDVFVATFLVLCAMYAFIYFHSNRYFLPGFVAMTGLIAYRFHHAHRFGPVRILITIFVVAAFAIAVRDKFTQTKRIYPIYKHNLSSAQYLPQLRALCYPISAHINQNLPEDSKIMFFNENRIYFCDRDASVFGAGSAGMIYEYTDLPAFYEQLKNDGITHIVFRPGAYEGARRAYYEYRMVETLDYMRRFVSVFCTPVHMVNTIVLYQLK